MLSHTQGASFRTFGTTNQIANAAENRTSEREVSRDRKAHAAPSAASGMKSPVFRSQNEITFVAPWSQPNSSPKNVPALATLSRVDHQICGSARTSAITTYTDQATHRLSRHCRNRRP